MEALKAIGVHLLLKLSNYVGQNDSCLQNLDVLDGVQFNCIDPDEPPKKRLVLEIRLNKGTSVELAEKIKACIDPSKDTITRHMDPKHFMDLRITDGEKNYFNGTWIKPLNQ